MEVPRGLKSAPHFGGRFSLKPAWPGAPLKSAPHLGGPALGQRAP